MTQKIISSLMSGMFISLGATAFIALNDAALHNIIPGAIIFTAGILMVSIFHNMLVTRAFALFAYKEYKVTDIIIAFLGNTAGTIIYAWLISLTRYAAEGSRNLETIQTVTGARLDDNYLSLFILSVFCGFIVAAACLTIKSLPDNRGAALALTSMFITVFIFCGFEHVVANGFFFSFYAINIDFEARLIPIYLIVAAGNAVGGIGTGYLNLFRERAKEKNELKRNEPEATVK